MPLHNQLQTYLQAIARAAEIEDGKDFANLFSYRVISKRLAYYVGRTDISQTVRSSPVGHVDDQTITEIVIVFLMAVAKVSDAKLREAFACHSQALEGVCEMIKVYEPGTKWLVHWYRKLARGLRLLAQRIDETEPESIDPHWQKVIQQLRTHFSVFNRPVATGRTSAALAIANECIMLFLAHNNATQCKSYTQWAEKVVQLTEEDFTTGEFAKADAVTFVYLRARLLLLDSQYAEVDRYLAFALRHCRRSSQKNMRIILSYLVPVKLNLGLLPQHGMLEQYHLKEFILLVKSLKEGNIRLYQEQLDLYQVDFISRGIYIILEKLKLFAYRNFFKRIWLLNDKSSRLRLLECIAVHQALDPETEVDLDELECFMANLIYRKKVRGYIAHDQRMVVLSKENAFPPYTG